MSCPTYWKYKCFLLVWENLLSLSVPGGTEKINGLCLLGGRGGDKYPVGHYVLLVGPSKQLPAQSSDERPSEVHS